MQIHRHVHTHVTNKPSMPGGCTCHKYLGMFMYLRNQMEWDHSLSHVSCSLCQQRGDLAKGQNMQPQASLDTKRQARSICPWNPIRQAFKSHYMSKIDMGHRGGGDTARRKEQREKRSREHSRFMVLVACFYWYSWLTSSHDFSNEHQDCWRLSLTTTSILIKCIIPRISDGYTLKDDKVLIISHMLSLVFAAYSYCEQLALKSNICDDKKRKCLRLSSRDAVKEKVTNFEASWFSKFISCPNFNQIYLQNAVSPKRNRAVNKNISCRSQEFALYTVRNFILWESFW